jgi:plastocyanin
MVSPLAFAEEGNTKPQGTVSYPDMVFSVDSIEMNEGETVTFTLSVTNNGGISGGVVMLYFDNSAFTVGSRVTRGSFNQQRQLYLKL